MYGAELVNLEKLLRESGKCSINQKDRRNDRRKGVHTDEEGDSLLRIENVISTPHIASSRKEAVYGAYRAAVENMIRYLKGEKPYWVVNPATVYKT